MKFTQTIIALAILSLAPSAFAGDTVATVNGKPIKQSVYDYIAKDATARGQKIDDQVKGAITNKLIDSEIVYQEAQKLGLDKQPDYVAREELSRRELLTSAYLQDFVKKNPISDADSKAAYEEYKKAYGDKEYSARHILVKTEAEAQEIIAKLGKGGDFAKIAKEKSLDPGSKEKGGDLGWFSPATMVKPFSDAVATLKKGGITSAPIQTQFGWHVIKLVDTRASQPLAYDKVKEGLQKNLQQRNLEKMMTELRAKAKVDISK
ncbi:MAG: peptidylprolyl isomerase [Methylotenera sp.]|uniref:peptidylprolyl isomerase n=1 Tax=Methylotenera sp. TaxID=2051956 RepID=UPI00271823E6|nr:peptidylprolyl isomerase [Methylotenera sp.]MDO9392541.1 peptidylprolyl isomerase [Methylotenera sp.]MDP1522280.1 peptidylprolyl isomerase [Methylotenera sp.]MDP2231152.1 peptidylprolyl isomerase [Methylotenera sp.]MDP3142012.1 peptidylprolyl isomerase [Methylotenera sp.]MDP3308522.1 peptidylprolyl isomerase [Methylotenera sp.]